MNTTPNIPKSKISTKTTDKLFSFEQCLTQLKSDKIVTSIGSDQNLKTLNLEDQFSYYQNMGDYLRETKCFDAALKCFIESLDILVGHVEQTASNRNVYEVAELHLQHLPDNVVLQDFSH